MFSLALLTLGAHAQQGLQYLVCLSVTVEVKKCFQNRFRSTVPFERSGGTVERKR